MKVMAPVMDEGRQAPRDFRTTVLSEEVALSSVLSYPPSLVFPTLFPHFSCLLAVHCRAPSACRWLTVQTGFLLAALALSISYPQLQRYMQYALKAELTSHPQKNPSLKRTRKSFGEAEVKKYRENYKGGNLGPFIMGAVLLVAALSWAGLCPFEDTTAHRQCWRPQKIWLYCPSQMIFQVAIHELHEGWDPEDTDISTQELQTVHKTVTRDTGGKTVCGNK